MIKSRRFTNDSKVSCARCSYLIVDNGKFKCKIDGAAPEYPDLISCCICDKFREVKKDGKL